MKNNCKRGDAMNLFEEIIIFDNDCGDYVMISTNYY